MWSAVMGRTAPSESPFHLGHAVKADGRWRLFAFSCADDPTALSSAIQNLCRFLAESSSSPVVKYTPKGTVILFIYARTTWNPVFKRLAPCNEPWSAFPNAVILKWAVLKRALIAHRFGTSIRAKPAPVIDTCHNRITMQSIEGRTL